LTQNTIHRLNDEMAKIKRTMDEISMLRGISQDLKSYRKMIKLRKYD
jgi:uncharacterized protein (UPF0335 family)